MWDFEALFKSQISLITDRELTQVELRNVLSEIYKANRSQIPPELSVYDLLTLAKERGFVVKLQNGKYKINRERDKNNESTSLAVAKSLFGRKIGRVDYTLDFLTFELDDGRRIQIKISGEEKGRGHRVLSLAELPQPKPPSCRRDSPLFKKQK